MGGGEEEGSVSSNGSVLGVSRSPVSYDSSIILILLFRELLGQFFFSFFLTQFSLD